MRDSMVSKRQFLKQASSSHRESSHHSLHDDMSWLDQSTVGHARRAEGGSTFRFRGPPIHLTRGSHCFHSLWGKGEDCPGKLAVLISPHCQVAGKSQWRLHYTCSIPEVTWPDHHYVFVWTLRATVIGWGQKVYSVTRSKHYMQARGDKERFPA